ncbi:DeoR/GlpR family DNA-binding transcription regulator [Alicyclobacillus sendaiensis]|uniref:DeoR/GlpR family DNA-binding transcription regulator n=1 Tax=Alicyclobacillus sendaiensis PA2 TaxID=3029425 RepID=A0ABT6Y1P5_ALISE|nr:DeoR/GlpR family DNA-binding transcription regulator [Alicyclobacillus sendaiensis]MDI9261222.1 DeoR/GlpR family DNA-binding transcription regulator [Alicyclobacillus sendaiensis PA2]
MLKSKRIQEIKSYVAQRQVVSIDELAERFAVSKNTIRRDIQELIENGEIKKIYGGVAINDATTPLLPFAERKVRNKHEKERIGEIAAQCVNEGDIIFIDSGTTTVEMFEYLKDKEITVVTSNLDFIVRALPYPNLTIICVGGMLERKTSSFVSFSEPSVLVSYNIQKAFMASTGVSLEMGVTNASALETEIKRIAVERSMRTYLLVDHTKFDRYGLMTYCQLSDIDVLVTNQTPSPRYLDYARIHGIEILTPTPQPS